MGLLEHNVVLITGGATGMGRTHAEVCAREGADVIIADIADPESEAFAKTVALVESYGRKALAVRANTTIQAELQAAVASGIAIFGKIDALIINAGIHREGRFWETEERDWDTVLAVNLTGAWKAAKAVAPHMIERGSGSIVMISSVDAYDADAEIGATAYGVSKAGLLGLMKYVASELAPHGVRCNAIAPGLIDTPVVNTQEAYDLHTGVPGTGTRKHLEDYARQFTALKGTSVLPPEDVANAAVYLNSHLAQHVTGVTIPVDAGHLLVSRVNRNPAP